MQILADFIVGGLAKVLIVVSDANEGFWCVQADDMIRFIAQIPAGFEWRNGNGDHDAIWFLPPQSADRRAHGRARGEAVIDEDHISMMHTQGLLSSAVA